MAAPHNRRRATPSFERTQTTYLTPTEPQIETGKEEDDDGFHDYGG